jgi:hypothetical protein
MTKRNGFRAPLLKEEAAEITETTNTINEKSSTRRTVGVSFFSFRQGGPVRSQNQSKINALTPSALRGLETSKDEN